MHERVAQLLREARHEVADFDDKKIGDHLLLLMLGFGEEVLSKNGEEM